MLPLKIAIRFLKSAKGQTVLIILGIAIGVSVQVFIGSLIQGLQKSLVETTVGNSSQITITQIEENEYINDYLTLRDDILENNDDITTVSYSLDTSGALLDDSTSLPILIRSFDYELANDIYEFDEKLVEGSLPSNINEIMVGTYLVEKLDLKIGDKVDLQIPLKGTTEVTIVGVYDFKVIAINKLWVMSTIPTVQTMLDIDDGISSIEIQVDDVFEADIISKKIINDVDDDALLITNWKELNEDLLGGLRGQSASSIMIQVFVTLSVLLGIASVLAITVLQKSRQLGILKAMGIKNKEASLIFLLEGLILGIFGAIFGILLGLGLAVSFSTFVLNADGTPIIALFIDPQFIVISAFIAVIASCIASIIPAIRSSKISIIEVIKNG